MTQKWGPIIWIFFHTIIEKLNDDSAVSTTGRELFYYFKRICTSLPCPECSGHATTFLNNVNVYNINTKEDLREIMFIFHNFVNKRKHKPIFKKEDLVIYKSNNLINCYNNFIIVFQSNGYMKLMGDSVHRNILIHELKQWMYTNKQQFLWS